MTFEASSAVLPEAVEPLLAGRRILVVHNFYRSDQPSGENDVVRRDVDLLRRYGAEVDTYWRSSDEIASMDQADRVQVALNLTTGRLSRDGFVAKLRAFLPDVVNLHNAYPLITPRIIDVAADAGVPVIQTVHNYRHECLAGSCFRAGDICTACTGRRVAWPGVVHGCYRGSRVQSAALAVAEWANTSSWRKVARFLPVSETLADRLVRAGVGREQITVLPNAVRDPGPPTPPGRDVLYAGRLTEEKGVRLLLDAWSQSGLRGRTRLIIAGSGPLEHVVRAAASADSTIEYVGYVGPERMATLMRSAAVVVVPSRWLEGMPLVALEALSFGRPILALEGGGVEAIAHRVDERMAAPRSAPGLAGALDRIGQLDLGAAGDRARALFLTELSDTSRVRAWADLLDHVVGNASLAAS